MAGRSGSGRSGRGVALAAITRVYTLAHVAEMLGEDVDWLSEISGDMEPEDGYLWIYGPNEEQTEGSKEMLTRLNVTKGDALYAVETPDGGYRLTPYDPDFAGKMDKADEIIRRYRNTLHVLAK